MPLRLQILLAGANLEYRRFLYRKTVILGYGEKFITRFGEGDVKDPFPAFQAFCDELQGEGRLPGAGLALN